MKFFSDFFNTFIGFLFVGLLVITNIFSEFFKFIKNICSFVKPLSMEILADISLILLFFYQISLSIFSSISLKISKFLFCISKVSYKKSEEIVNKLWI